MQDNIIQVDFSKDSEQKKEAIKKAKARYLREKRDAKELARREYNEKILRRMKCQYSLNS